MSTTPVTPATPDPLEVLYATEMSPAQLKAELAAGPTSTFDDSGFDQAAWDAHWLDDDLSD